MIGFVEGEREELHLQIQQSEIRKQAEEMRLAKLQELSIIVCQQIHTVLKYAVIVQALRRPKNRLSTTRSSTAPSTATIKAVQFQPTKSV